MPAEVFIRTTLILAVGIALLIVPGASALAQIQVDESGGYSDRIHLRNGDVITGSMKELDRGKLRVKTRTMDDIYINWVYIESIDTDKYLRSVKQMIDPHKYGIDVQRYVYWQQ